MTDPPPDLTARVDKAIAQNLGDRARLVALSSDLDRGTGMVARFIMLTLLLMAWVGFPVLAGLAGWQLDYLRCVVQYGAVWVVLVASGVIFWRPIWSSRTNRGFWTLSFLSTVFTLLALFMGWHLERGITEALLVKTFCDAALACVAAFLFELLLIPAALLYVGFVVVGVLAPEWAYTAGRLATLCLVMNGLFAWPWLRMRP